MICKINVYELLQECVHVDVSTILDFDTVRRQSTCMQDYFTSIFLYFQLKIKKHKKQRSKSHESVHSSADQENSDSTVKSASVPTSPRVMSSGPESSPAEIQASPTEWRSDTVADLLENKRLYKSIKSTVKSIIKKIYLQTHPDKVSDPFLNALFVKTKKWLKKKQFYKLLFVCKILSITIARAKLEVLQPYFINEVQLLAQRLSE